MLYLNAKKLSSILMLVIKSKKLRQWLETQQGTIKSSFLTYTTTQGEKSYQGKSQIPLSRSLFSKPFKAQSNPHFWHTLPLKERNHTKGSLKFLSLVLSSLSLFPYCYYWLCIVVLDMLVRSERKAIRVWWWFCDDCVSKGN